MTLNTPAEIRLGRQALTLIDRLLDAAAPEEGCALLLGTRRRGPHDPAGVAPIHWYLRRVWPTLNAWEPEAERLCRFRIDPREQLHAQKWARAHGLEVLGSLHSHPLSPPLPSATDCALAFAPTLMLIRGVATGEPPLVDGQGAAARPLLRCWWLEPELPPRHLPWRMED
jgi:proteasome lid subunit RPN8/RPN11